MAAIDDLSFQLYSARNLQPLDSQIELLAGLGYRRVEPFGGLFNDVPKLRDLLQRHDLTAPSAHVGLDRLRADPVAATRLCRELGISLILAPAPPQNERDKDAAGWRALGQELARIGKVVTGEGLRFGWHNHHWEFQKQSDGSFGMDLILGEAPELLWQMDIAWVVRGAADPLVWLAKYAGRIPSVHIKDLAPAGQCTDEDGWADVGHGTLDWTKLLPAARKAGATLLVAEHDKPNDVARFARRTIATVKNWN
ncbi:MAG: sugar phosphate isomerase/epimerase [Alphaproteobacteria bacterium]|nr:sugar phosphate isomerase/epimerase [Alphaproteobacteria bacterium]